TEESARTLELSVLSSAQMEALKIVRTRQEELLEDFLDRAEEVISGYRKSQRYAALLSRLVKIAREALGNDCIISVAREDKDKLPAGVKATESDDDGVQKYGGIIASSSDGSLELNLSLKEIFSGIREKLISSILERLEE
ncbi:MAG TPA: V-type ATP synthase subunit E family protein, partial [Thermoplasmataceae archaeon]|nr:V-type ATP synthase subunit E family protein [Thermoplasmataceae archaeon]